VEPTTFVDLVNERVLCMWPTSAHQDEWQTIAVEGARPVDYGNWTKVSEDKVRAPASIREQMLASPFYSCQGTQSCCFQTEHVKISDEIDFTPPPAGNMHISFGKYNVSGMVCGQPIAETIGWFPYKLDEGPFPFVVFGHGLGSGIARDLMKSMASLGMIVVAPKDFQKYCPTWMDDLQVINQSRSNPDLFKALPYVDWTSVGIVGHSMGGNQAIKAGTEIGFPNSYNVKAIIASHGVNDVTGLKIPTMFETSIYDRTVHPSKVKDAFEQCTPNPKIFVNCADGGHMEPTKEGLANTWMSHFFGCHLAGLVDSCHKVYSNTSDGMCQDKNLSECIVVKPAWL